MKKNLTRRGFVAGAAALTPGAALAQTVLRDPKAKPEIGIPPSVVTQPPRQWGPGAPPDVFPDPDVIIYDDAFARVITRYSAIQRIGTGYRWAEGVAWNAEGNYVLFSDVQGDTQYRYIWETGEITPFRKPSYNSNGNTFDFQGRQVSCQHYFRRVVRWELDGSMTVIADKYKGTYLNAPNDVIVHPDGSIWFTDSGAGASISEGHADEKGGPQNPNGLYDPNLGDRGTGIIGGTKRSLPSETYRWDPKGTMAPITPGEVVGGNGLCFAPDYKTFYIISGGFTGGGIYAYDMAPNGKLSNKRLFTDLHVEGVYCHPDGMRADRAGNIWVSANGPLGFSGITVWNPAGKCIGRIRVPEPCANLCFAGPKRDYVFLAAGQSVYMLRVSIQGSAPG
jgi:gluconolactonase